MIFGRPETFAIAVNPLAGGPADGDPASGSTWAAMRIHVAGRNLYRNVNRTTRAVEEDISWPAVNLARWLVRSWSRLFHTGAWPTSSTRRNARDVAYLLDERLAANFDAPDDLVDSRDEFVAAHSMRAAAAGAALPTVWLSRDGGIISVAWRDSMDGEIFFTLSRGEEDVPAVDFAEAVRDFVEWVRGLLEERCPGEASRDIKLFSVWLEDFASVDGASSALLAETGLSQERCQRVARMAGLQQAALSDLFQLEDRWFAHGTLADVRRSPVAVAFRCAAPTVSDAELVSIRRQIIEAESNEQAAVALDDLARRVARPTRATRDYVTGYRLARSLRRVLENESERMDIESLLDDPSVGTVELALSDTEIDGGCVCDTHHGPLVFVNPQSKKAATAWGRRMVLAHELCHLLFDRHEAVGLGVMSGPWAPPRIERTANAFAIELLLPLAGVLETVGPAWENTQDDQVEALMSKYALGITAATQHLHNLADQRNR